jgi:hypothetical protein
MMRHILFAAFLMLLFSVDISAQNNYTNAPVSMFGIGEIYSNEGGKYSGMGETGLAIRSGNYIGSANPAAITTLDSLRFTFEAGVFGSKRRYYSGKSSNNATLGGPGMIGMGFRIVPRLYGSVTFSSYSNAGYYITVQNQTEGAIDVSTYDRYEGDGGLFKAAATTAYQFNKNLSLGATVGYIGGRITQSEANGTASKTYIIRRRSFDLELGAQYTHFIDKYTSVNAGAYYSMKQDFIQKATRTLYSSTNTDMNKEENWSISPQSLPQSFGVGFSYNLRRWTFTGDYRNIQWEKALVSDAKNVRFQNQNKIALGALWATDYEYNNPWQIMMGVGLSDPYVIVKDENSKNFYVTAGVTFPFQSMTNSSNISLALKYADSTKFGSALVRNRSIGLSLTVVFSERTFRSKLR